MSRASSDHKAVHVLVDASHGVAGLDRTIAHTRAIGAVHVAVRDAHADLVREHQGVELHPIGPGGSAWDQLAQHLDPAAPRLLLRSGEAPDRALAEHLCNGVEGTAPVRVRELFFGRQLRFGGFGPRREPRFIAGSGAAQTDPLPGSIVRVRSEPIDQTLGAAIVEARDLADAAARSRDRGERVRSPIGRRFGATRLFVWRYVFRGGFLDGLAGFHRAKLEANSRYMARMLVDERLGRISHERHDPTTIIGREMLAKRALGPVSHLRPDPSEGLFPVSVMILTKDEDINIEACLASLAFSDDIVVYDSLSTDKTVELARQFPGVRIVERAFDNWSAHQNWAVRNIEFEHPWVLYIDADERVPPDLAEEIMRMADPASGTSAYRMRRKDMFMGKWIRHATLYPTWIVRMFRPESIRYERLVNPVAEVDGEVGNLDGHLIHYPFSKGVRQWVERHNSYSDFEAMEQLKVEGGQRKPIRGIFSKDPNTRRAALKDIFFRLPMRAQLKWLYYVLVRRAFLDGKAGMTYARLQSIYEHLIRIKSDEMRSRD